MIRLVRATLFVAVLAAIAASAALAQTKLERYESPKIPASKRGLRFSVGYPAAWATAWGGERTRFYPAEAEGPYSAPIFVHVDAFARDEGGAEGLLSQRDGLELWLRESRPRFEVEDRRRLKVGAAGTVREALLAKDPSRFGTGDRRELFVLVPAGDVNFLLRFSTPYTEYTANDPLFRSILASFEVTGG
jgi:hypothetical protein